MKAKFIRIISLALSFVLVFGMTLTANAASQRASDYFAFTEVWATATSNGKFTVEFDITSTDYMQELGASSIYIYEQQSDGSYDNVKTFTRYNTSGLIEKNVDCAYGIVTYQGTPGVKYFASVALYAKDSSGSETLYSRTNTITA